MYRKWTEQSLKVESLRFSLHFSVGRCLVIASSFEKQVHTFLEHRKLEVWRYLLSRNCMQRYYKRARNLLETPNKSRVRRRRRTRSRVPYRTRWIVRCRRPPGRQPRGFTTRGCLMRPRASRKTITAIVLLWPGDDAPRPVAVVEVATLLLLVGFSFDDVPPDAGVVVAVGPVNVARGCTGRNHSL